MDAQFALAYMLSQSDVGTKVDPALEKARLCPYVCYYSTCLGSDDCRWQAYSYIDTCGCPRKQLLRLVSKLPLEFPDMSDALGPVVVKITPPMAQVIEE